MTPPAPCGIKGVLPTNWSRIPGDGPMVRHALEGMVSLRMEAGGTTARGARACPDHARRRTQRAVRVVLPGQPGRAHPRPASRGGRRLRRVGVALLAGQQASSMVPAGRRGRRDPADLAVDRAVGDRVRDDHHGVRPTCWMGVYAAFFSRAAARAHRADRRRVRSCAPLSTHACAGGRLDLLDAPRSSSRPRRSAGRAPASATRLTPTR
jgi:hypothetical protein